MDETQLRLIARVRLETDALPRAGLRHLRSGPGVGERCMLCGRAISPADTQFEMERADTARGGRYLTMHARCHAVYEFERERHRRA
jgi:hypothetical protein